MHRERIRRADALMKELFPLCRSITGEGNRETLRIIARHVPELPLRVLEYPTGTKTYDWTIPDEWRIRGGWIRNARGETLLDFADNNLHVMNYSVPVRGSFTLEELRPHLFMRDDLPEAVPYRTSYYNRNWGFCLSRERYERDFARATPRESFEVCIDADLFSGSLSVGEVLIPGREKRETLISTYFCHPSLANDNLSGTVLTALLAGELLRRDNRYSYRVLFVPETIGAIAYLAHNESAMQDIEEGFVVTCVAGKGPYGYKAAFDPSCRMNRIAEEMFAERGIHPLRYPFDPHGSDERQYASPGFRINTVSICKDKYYEYTEYHTSLDTLAFTSPEALIGTLELHLDAIARLEAEEFYLSTQPRGEVMLSPRGLYPAVGGGLLPGQSADLQLDLTLWLLCLCDGSTSLQDICVRTGLAIKDLRGMAGVLTGKGLLRPLAAPLPRPRKRDRES